MKKCNALKSKPTAEVVAFAVMKNYSLSFPKALQGTANPGVAPISIAQCPYSIEQTALVVSCRGERNKARAAHCFCKHN
jgi:hypothetical protein